MIQKLIEFYHWNKFFIAMIVFKIEFKTSLKFYFVFYNAKNNILSLKILFVGYKKNLGFWQSFCHESK